MSTRHRNPIAPLPMYLEDLKVGYVSLDDMATIIGCSRRKLERDVAKGALRVVRFGDNTVRVRKEDAIAYGRPSDA